MKDSISVLRKSVKTAELHQDRIPFPTWVGTVESWLRIDGVVFL